MSASVIICGVRGPTGVDLAQIKQMGGRAGRGKKDINATVHIVAEEDCISALSGLDSAPPISSVFDEERAVSFHLLSKIDELKSKENVEKWFSRSLAYAQGKKPNFDAIFERLVKLQLCEGYKEKNLQLFRLTGLGEVCKRYYFSPEAVFCWKEKFSTLFVNNDFCDECAIAWALATGRISFDVSVGVADELLSQFAADFRPRSEYAPEAVLWLSIFRGVALPGGASLKKGLKSDWGRISSALRAIDKCLGWNQELYWDNLDIMVKHGVPYGAVKYFSLPKMTSDMARHCYECGISVDDGIIELS